jgi:hypothetical protein
VPSIRPDRSYERVPAAGRGAAAGWDHEIRTEEIAIMPCPAEIRRSYLTRDEAFRYLTSRGFICTHRGWENGRWTAHVEYARPLYHLTVRLGQARAA